MKALGRVLEECDEEQLDSIFRLWAVMREPQYGKAQQLDKLIKQMHQPLAARFVFEQLTEDERGVLYRLLPPATRGGTVRDQSLLKRMHLPPERTEIALDRLAELALVQFFLQPLYQTDHYVTTARKPTKSELFPHVGAFVESVESLYQIAREYFTPSGDRTQWELDRLIMTLSGKSVEQAIKDYDIAAKAMNGLYYSREDAFGLLTDHLAEIEEPLDELPKLNPLARNIFIWLREHHGKAPMAEVRSAIQVDDVELYKALSLLAQYGLAFDSFSLEQRVVFVPETLYSTMRPPGVPVMADREEARLIELDHEPATLQMGEHIAVYDIATLVGGMYQQTIEPTQAGHVPKRISVKLRPILRGQPRPDYDKSDAYLEFVIEAAEQIGIIKLTSPPFQDVKPAYEVTTSVEKWAKKSLLAQTQKLLAHWLSNYSWGDTYGLNYSSWSTYSWDFTGGRKALIKHLLACSPARWYTIESLLGMIWEEDAFAYRPTQPYGRGVKLKKDADTHLKWRHCEGEIYAGILSSTLREFGIVDVGYERPDALSSTTTSNPDFFLVTEFGHRAMGGDTLPDEEEMEQERTFVVQPNFEILHLHQNLATLYALLPFAQANQLGLVSRLTLTRASLTRGLQVGKNVEQIVQFLRDHSQKELPQNVEYTLHDWTKSFKSAKVSQVLLFEVSSQEAEQILALLPALQHLRVRQLAPCIFAIQGNVDILAARKELEKAGVFVHFSGDIFTRPASTSSPNKFFTFDRYR